MDKTPRNSRGRRRAKPVNGGATPAAIRPLLTEDEVAAVLGIASTTLRNARSSGVGGFAGLSWIKLGQGRGRGNPIRYRPEEVERFIAERERGHEALEEQ